MWKLAIAAIKAIWKSAYIETAQPSKSQRPLNSFGSDRSDRSDRSYYLETSL